MRASGDDHMEMDDGDFIGQIEFNLSPEQRQIVGRAISLAASCDDDGFRQLNPLISIMQWWEANVPANEKVRGTPEATLAGACQQFVSAHEKLK
jgi:hypothetical protein